MIAMRNITDSPTLARIQNPDAVIREAPITVAIGNRKDMATKAVFPATRIWADIHAEDANLRAVARITGVAVGKTNATKAIVKAGMAAMVARAPSAATAKD